MWIHYIFMLFRFYRLVSHNASSFFKTFITASLILHFRFFSKKVLYIPFEMLLGTDVTAISFMANAFCLCTERLTELLVTECHH